MLTLILDGMLQGADPSQQSPWEMFNEDVQPEEVLAEAPALEASLQQRARTALDRLSRAPRFQLFHETPTPEAVYSTGDDGEGLWVPSLLLAWLALACMCNMTSLPTLMCI